MSELSERIKAHQALERVRREARSLEARQAEEIAIQAMRNWQQVHSAMLAAIAAANKDFVDANLANVFKYENDPTPYSGLSICGLGTLWHPSHVGGLTLSDASRGQREIWPGAIRALSGGDRAGGGVVGDPPC